MGGTLESSLPQPETNSRSNLGRKLIDTQQIKNILETNDNPPPRIFVEFIRGICCVVNHFCDGLGQQQMAQQERLL